jgi:hypothetical protein
MKAGDKVSVLNDNLKGKIIKIHKNLITIEDEYGFEHTYPSSEIVPSEADLYNLQPVTVKPEPQKNISKKNKIPLWFWIFILINWSTIRLITIHGKAFYSETAPAGND